MCSSTTRKNMITQPCRAKCQKNQAAREYSDDGTERSAFWACVSSLAKTRSSFLLLMLQGPSGAFRAPVPRRLGLLNPQSPGRLPAAVVPHGVQPRPQRASIGPLATNFYRFPQNGSWMYLDMLTVLHQKPPTLPYPHPMERP